MKSLMKPLLVSSDHHSKIMEYKARLKLKTADQAIGKILEEVEWTV